MSLSIPASTGIRKCVKKILDASVEIRMNSEPAEYDKAFLARQLVQVTLPHSNPGNIPAWKRTNGNLSLVIRPGWNHKTEKEIGYPYGTLPRLLLFWITTEALRTGSRRIELGSSLAAFMRELGLDPSNGSGPRSDARRLKDQMERLFRATISFEYNKEERGGNRKSWLDMQVAPKGEFWWSHTQLEQTTLWESWIELGEDFYNSIVSAPVPLDMRALMALKSSSLSLDIYAWATYKTFSLGQQQKNEQFIPWEGFMSQLGAEYTNVMNFKLKAKEAFKKVQVVYPGLQVEGAIGGFIIKKGKTAITACKSNKKLSTNTNGKKSYQR